MKLAPQLATLAKRPPAGAGWLYEAKLDGYRVLARLDTGQVRLITRNGHDWTAKMPTLARELATLDLQSAWLDGEIVVLRPDGVPDFNALQNAMDASKAAAVTFFVFDIPFADGHDLTQVALTDRRALLRDVMAQHPGSRVKFSDNFAGDAEALLKAAFAMGLEGIVAKRKDAPYVSSRTSTWVKVKCTRRQAFVVIGFVDRVGSNKSEVGSLLLGYFEGDRLRYAGSCGTGWDARTGAELHRRLANIEVAIPPIAAEELKPSRWSRRRAGSERWVKPELVVDIEFTEWTPDGQVRHPSFRAVHAAK